MCHVLFERARTGTQHLHEGLDALYSIPRPSLAGPGAADAGRGASDLSHPSPSPHRTTVPKRLQVVKPPWIDPRLILAAIVDASDDAIIGKTLQGVITSWNAGAERLYGYSAEQMVGRSISVLIPLDRPDELEQILARVRRGERVEHLETKRVHKDGRPIDVSLNVFPIRDADGSFVGASLIARNITDRRRGDIATSELAGVVDSSYGAVSGKT